MIKFIFFIVLFLGVSIAAFANEFEVTGIIFQKEPVAIVNGKIVKVGDKIDDAVVQKILDKSVIFKYKGEIIIKNVSGKKLPKDIEADIDKKQLDEKPSKMKFSFFPLALVLILAGAGFYFFEKSKHKNAPEQ